MERLIDLAAREHGFDRVALRRKNLVTEKELPYKNPFGVEYDNGDYIGGMDTALETRRLGGLQEAPRRGAESAANTAASASAITSTSRPACRARKPRSRCCPDGAVELVIGIVSQGQGHETSFAQLVTEWLGVPIEAVRFVAGDTDRVTVGGGAHSGRGMRLGSIVIKKSSDGIIEKGMRIAEHLLETAAADIEFKDGRFAVKGTNHAVGLFEVARAAAERSDLPEDLRGPLYAACDETVLEASYPYGAHVCEVEVDPDTGKVTRDQLRRGRRRRPRGEPADHPRPGPWRHRARASARRCSNTPITIRKAAKCWRARSWTTPCRAPPTWCST